MNRYCISILPLAIFIIASSAIQKEDERQQQGSQITTEFFNPYENVDWNKFEHLHSFSHQHGNRPPSYSVSAEEFWDMGFRHLPFSNYYPSAPSPLPLKFREKHPDALWAPNAEQHSAFGVGHFNVIDSYYSTGHGQGANISYRKNRTSPIEYEFSGLNVYNPEKPWLSIYWLDLRISGKDEAVILITLEGACKVNPTTYEVVKDGDIKDSSIPAKSRAIYIRAESDKVKVRLDFNPDEISDVSLVIRQGVHRPWKDAFRAALDGTLKDKEGNPIEGLRFSDGGGITLNHTGGPVNSVLEKLRFDSRVLGIEVWNQHYAFGPKGSLAFYNLWDEVLKTGTRCFGFFVKDHFIYERGRNVLLVPSPEKLTIAEREHNCSRAYRNGTFYGLIGALAVDEKGQKTPPYDYSSFRFTQIILRKNSKGIPETIEVSVDGADKTKRPNTQIRFITEKGISMVENSSHAFYKLTKDAGGNVLEKYVRIEAFAYPSTYLKDKPLTAEILAKMNVLEISRLHDNTGGGYSETVDFDKGKEVPIPIVDMLFSQPIMFNKQP